jgi:hypothetical protein
MFNKSRKPPADFPSSATSKRRVNRSRELWDDFFHTAFEAMIASDDDRVKEVSDEEARVLVDSAAKYAEAALAKIEERFPGGL